MNFEIYLLRKVFEIFFQKFNFLDRTKSVVVLRPFFRKNFYKIFHISIDSENTLVSKRADSHKLYSIISDFNLDPPNQHIPSINFHVYTSKTRKIRYTIFLLLCHKKKRILFFTDPWSLSGVYIYIYIQPPFLYYYYLFNAVQERRNDALSLWITL